MLYGALTTGAKSMGIVTGIPLALLLVIVTFAMLFWAAPDLSRSMWRLGGESQASRLARTHRVAWRTHLMPAEQADAGRQSRGSGADTRI